jgi:hypothetical protein
MHERLLAYCSLGQGTFRHEHVREIGSQHNRDRQGRNQDARISDANAFQDGFETLASWACGKDAASETAVSVGADWQRNATSVRCHVAFQKPGLMPQQSDSVCGSGKEVFAG